MWTHAFHAWSKVEQSEEYQRTTTQRLVTSNRDFKHTLRTTTTNINLEQNRSRAEQNDTETSDFEQMDFESNQKELRHVAAYDIERHHPHMPIILAPRTAAEPDNSWD